MVHHTSLEFSWSGGRPTFGNSQLGDQSELYISQLSS
jgi:hypothetical protein